MNAQTSNVVAINPKGDAAIANDTGKAQRAQILENIDTAEDLMGTALVEGLRMTALYGPTSKAEVQAHYTRCGSPEVYASWFNRGDKAAQVVGETLALQAIDQAIAKGTGPMFQRAREALAGICAAAKSAGVKELDKKSAKAAVTAAVTAAQAGAADRKAKKSADATLTAARGTKSPDTKTLAVAALECGKGHREMAAFVRLGSQMASRLPEVQGRETAHREAVAALQHAAEKWAVFLK